jgi:hypothetical protein
MSNPTESWHSSAPPKRTEPVRGPTKIANQLPTLGPGRDQASHGEPGRLRKQNRGLTCSSGRGQAQAVRVRRSCNNLKTVARKGLWVRVQRPPLKSALTWRFAIPGCYCLPDEQQSEKPLSQVPSLPESSDRVRLRLAGGAKSPNEHEAANLLPTLRQRVGLAG